MPIDTKILFPERYTSIVVKHLDENKDKAYTVKELAELLKIGSTTLRSLTYELKDKKLIQMKNYKNNNYFFSNKFSWED